MTAVAPATVRRSRIPVRRSCIPVGRSSSTVGWWAGSAVIVRPAVIASAVATIESMTAPPVVIAPVCPGTYAKEYAVVEVSRPVIAVGSASIRGIAVITIRTDRWRPADRDGDLGFG